MYALMSFDFLCVEYGILWNAHVTLWFRSEMLTCILKSSTRADLGVVFKFLTPCSKLFHARLGSKLDILFSSNLVVL